MGIAIRCTPFLVNDHETRDSIQIHCAYTKLLPLSELSGMRNPNNTNDHPPEQILELVEQFKFQGVRHPIIISNRDGKFAAGDGRFQAAEKLGLTEFPVDYQDFDSEEQQFAFGIADNEIQRWSITNFKRIHLELPNKGPFEIKRLAIRDFQFEPNPNENDADAVPEPPSVAKTKRGELWILGEHRLLIDDCTVKENIERLMAGERADITFTSPPYNLGVSAQLRGNTAIGKAGNAYVGTDDAKTENDWFELVARSTENSLAFSRYALWNIQFLAGNRTALPAYWAHFASRICDVAVIDKGHAPPAAAERVMNSRFEFVFIFTSDDTPSRAIRTAPQFRGTVDNVFEMPPQRRNENANIHGATMPVEWAEKFITLFSEKSCIEMFAGTGTTIIACEKTKRRCFGMEIEPLYGDVILDRFQRYSGKVPVREDGVTWDEVKAAFEKVEVKG